MTNDERLQNSAYFVEATNFEQLCLNKKFDLIAMNEGFGKQVGQIDEDKPIYVSFSFYKLLGELVCFFEIVSRFSDFKVVEDFLKQYNKKEGSIDLITDAMNFHNVKSYILRKNNGVDRIVKKINVKITKDIYPNKNGGASFPLNVIEKGKEIIVEKHDEDHYRYSLKGTCCYIPVDSFKEICTNKSKKRKIKNIKE